MIVKKIYCDCCGKEIESEPTIKFSFIIEQRRISEKIPQNIIDYSVNEIDDIVEVTDDDGKTLIQNYGSEYCNDCLLKFLKAFEEVHNKKQNEA